MQFEKADIQAEIDKIETRLQNDQNLKGVLGTTPTKEDELFNRIFDKPTNAAREESMVDRAQAKALNSKVQQIRDWLVAGIKQGIMTIDPADPENTESDTLYIYQSPVAELAIGSDPNELIAPNPRLTRLMIIRSWDKDVTIRSKFYFFGEADMEIEYGDPQTNLVGFEYFSSKKPIAQITIPEYKILTYLTEEFIEHTEQAKPQE